MLDYKYFDSLSTVVAKPTTLYYRIEEFDINGNVTYSNTLPVNLSPDNRVIKVFPNPTASVIYIQSDGDINSALLQLVGMSGKTVYRAVNNLSANATTQINVAALPAGKYILTIQAKGVNENIKVVKQ